MNELKPCPFCGGKAELIRDIYSTHVRCSICKARATPFWGKPYANNETQKMAIEAWNKRNND
jgi:Lar family restriction alleviation protein